jgi:hypothetical protein
VLSDRRLAIDHPLRRPAVTGTLHRDAGRGAFNFEQIFLSELEREFRCPVGAAVLEPDYASNRADINRPSLY